MNIMKNYSVGQIGVYVISIILFIIFPEVIKAEKAFQEEKTASHARIPEDIPLDAVKWESGFWYDRMQSIGDIYLPAIFDNMFLDPKNGSSFNNFLKVAGMEKGVLTGLRWGDGDCYFILDAASRVYAYRRDEYLKKKMDFWIPVIAKCRRENGTIDTWSSLGGKPEQNQKIGDVTYNHGHLFTAATSHQIATGEDEFKNLAVNVLSSYLESNGPIGNNIPWTYCSLYKSTGENRYLNPIIKYYSNYAPFGPLLRDAREIFGHGTVAHHYLIGATALYDCTGEKELLESLKRLADNTMSKKTFISGAVGSVKTAARPELTLNGKVYKSARINEGIGVEYDLSNDSSYNESCTICLNMEWMYRMFRLTGEAVYMDAVERSMYNGVPGCIDLEKARFFYANPQEQTSGSKRFNTQYDAPRGSGLSQHYTWKRVSPMTCSCCPPKILRALAMCNEIAYSVNNEGLWVNLYGSNSITIKVPSVGLLECQQTTEYPWDGKVQLVINKLEDKKEFTIFLRIPGWVNTPAKIRVNGKVIEKAAKGGTYYKLTRKWSNGDKVEMELAMPVRFMAADPGIADDRGKVAVMRGPVVYCVEDGDIPEGLKIDSLYITGAANLKPETTEELGGITKLTGSLIYRTSETKKIDVAGGLNPENGLYQEIRLDKNIKISEKDRSVRVSMIPYYARLNRESNYFKIWLPLYNYVQ